MNSNDKLAGVQETTRLDTADAFTPEQLAASLTAPQFAPIDLDKLSDQTIEQERLTPTQEQIERQAELRPIVKRYEPGHYDSGGIVEVEFSNDDQMKALLAALKSPPIGGDPAFEIETRFWSIVDRDGLSGFPSDMWVALESLVERAKPKPTTSGDVGKLCEELEAAAWGYIRHGEFERDDAPLQAATLLTQMEAREIALRTTLETAESALDQLLDDMGETGQCVCPAAKFEAIDALADVRRALLTGAGS